MFKPAKPIIDFYELEPWQARFVIRLLAECFDAEFICREFYDVYGRKISKALVKSMDCDGDNLMPLPVTLIDYFYSIRGRIYGSLSLPVANKIYRIQYLERQRLIYEGKQDIDRLLKIFELAEIETRKPYEEFVKGMKELKGINLEKARKPMEC